MYCDAQVLDHSEDGMRDLLCTMKLLQVLFLLISDITCLVCNVSIVIQQNANMVAERVLPKPAEASRRHRALGAHCGCVCRPGHFFLHCECFSCAAADGMVAPGIIVNPGEILVNKAVPRGTNLGT